MFCTVKGLKKELYWVRPAESQDDNVVLLNFSNLSHKEKKKCTTVFFTMLGSVGAAGDTREVIMSHKRPWILALLIISFKQALSSFK